MRNKLMQMGIFWCFIMAGVAGAQASDSYDLTWNVIGAGGGSSDSPSYKLNGTVGQPVIGSSTDTNTIDSGYWYGINQFAVGNNPIAIIGLEKLRCENVGAPVQFNGSGSYDTDGTIVSYYWDFGDGTNVTDPEPKHTYIAYKWNGTAYQIFTVNLTIKDNSDLTNITSQNVMIWIPGDANDDGKVNILDASVVGLNWNGSDPCANLNNDATVNILDSRIIGLNWGKFAIIGD